MNCDHPNVVFCKKDLAFFCEKCIEKLQRVDRIETFKLFCEWTGRSENEMLAGVFFYIKLYYVKLSKKLLKKK